jgi:hypothetical protein
MLRVFNLGLGLVFVTPRDVTVHSAAVEVGRVVPRQAEQLIVLNAEHARATGGSPRRARGA